MKQVTIFDNLQQKTVTGYLQENNEVTADEEGLIVLGVKTREA